jgi:glycerol transport system ATP-binding protein
MTLQLEKVSKRVGAEKHLYDIDLSLAHGSQNVLLGPTLAGKTSLMRLMAGLDRPTSGRLLLDGQEITGVPVRKRSVAMVYQEFINYPSLTVYNNIASPLRRAGVAKDEIDRKVRQAAGALDIDDLLERLPSELSGGQQQRTALARALVKEAELLLLDEPLVNLDYKLREQLREELKTIFAQGKSIVVYATTEPVEALMLGGNTVVIDEGRVLQSGPTIEVYHNPASVRVSQVFSDPPMNMIDGFVADGQAHLGQISVPLLGHLAQLAPGRYRFAVRASHLTLASKSGDDVGFEGIIELSEISGSETFIHVGHGGTSWVVQEEGVYSIGIDKHTRVFINPRNIFAFNEAGNLVAAPNHGPASLAAQQRR